ncbi:group III truncated hemoglobin [Pseudoxanthomonas mexicana]|uniref:group III truncated hemoglobin n=1 Tax=Pseudoxanthomonas mexicana TaxID=128785 RepID=UPI00398AD040
MNDRPRIQPVPAAPPRPGPELCSEEEVVRLVHDFYARVRLDARLGPIFEARVHDWPEHLDQLVAFWSALLRGTRRFRGAPMPKHMAIPGLSAELFLRWLELFAQTTAESGNPALRAEADEAAWRIADNFWQRYQMQQDPFATPSPLRQRSVLPILGG